MMTPVGAPSEVCVCVCQSVQLLPIVQLSVTIGATASINYSANKSHRRGLNPLSLKHFFSLCNTVFGLSGEKGGEREVVRFFFLSYRQGSHSRPHSMLVLIELRVSIH